MGWGLGLSGSPARGAMGLAPKLCQVGQGQRVSRGGGVIPVPGAVWTMWGLMLSHRGDPRECLLQPPPPMAPGGWSSTCHGLEVQRTQAQKDT